MLKNDYTYLKNLVVFSLKIFSKYRTSVTLTRFPFLLRTYKMIILGNVIRWSVLQLSVVGLSIFNLYLCSFNGCS